MTKNMEMVALILGGTVPHMELIRQLKERGYYTILIDYLDNPPAKTVADEHIQESTLDKDAVLATAVERKASLVISGCVDQANITACYVMEKLGLRPPYSYDIAGKITNKGCMKKVMLENGIPTSRYFYIDDAGSMPDICLDYPVMVKPADSNSANGVKKANDFEEMRHYLEEAISLSRNKKAIVEEFVEGREISAYCFVSEGRAHLLMTAERVSVTEGKDNVIKCYASIAPARISENASAAAEQIASQIAKAFGLDNTPLFFQGIVRGDAISVIEFAPRVGGGISYKTILMNTGFDIISATIDSYLGRKVAMSYTPPRKIMTVNTVYGENGIFDHITGQEEILEDGTIDDMFLHKCKGAVIDDAKASTGRIGAFIASGSSMKEVYGKINRAYRKLNVADINGNDMIRRDLNLNSIENGKAENMVGGVKPD